MHPVVSMVVSQSKTLVGEAVRTSLTLFKIMIPIIILVKIMKELDWIQYVAAPLAPLMELLNLPAQTGLVFATGIVVNLYSAIIVYISLIPEMGVLTVAQATVLGVMMLVAHSLPVELKIAQVCGISFWGQAVLRMVGAVVFGAILSVLFSQFQMLQEPSVIPYIPQVEDPSLQAWALGEAKGLLWVFLIILTLMTVVKVLDYLKVTALFAFVLSPVLRLMGIGKAAASITIAGLTLGISFGAGLIIPEARSGRLPHKDLFASLSLMGLCHGLIEDTLLMALIGASTIGTFWMRLVLSILAIAVLTRCYDIWAARRVSRQSA